MHRTYRESNLGWLFNRKLMQGLRLFVVKDLVKESGVSLP